MSRVRARRTSVPNPPSPALAIGLAAAKIFTSITAATG
jgi:hypothetical protein